MRQPAKRLAAALKQIGLALVVGDLGGKLLAFATNRG
jgi:hypothetical protein